MIPFSLEVTDELEGRMLRGWGGKGGFGELRGEETGKEEQAGGRGG